MLPEPMQGMSEDEGDAEDAPELIVDDAKNEAARKAREDRQEKLRKMMDDDGKHIHIMPRIEFPNAVQTRICLMLLARPILNPSRLLLATQRHQNLLKVRLRSLLRMAEGVAGDG
jgi:hypothetical protein